MCNIYSGILSGTMDAFASIISNNLNIVMKILHLHHHFDGHPHYGVQLLRHECGRAAFPGVLDAHPPCRWCSPFWWPSHW